jgi:hypothetical protein
MSTEEPLERALAEQLIAISVSDSPDLGRLGLLERSLRQTVAAIVTRLVSHGARIAYGGNLNKRGYTYQLYPTIAQAYATAACRSARPPFVHYVAAYLAQDPAEVAAHLRAVGGFAEVRLVAHDGKVAKVVSTGKEIIGWSAGRETRVKQAENLMAFAADIVQPSAGPPNDLDAMRRAMENDVTARIIIGGAVAGYSGRQPGVLQEALLTLQERHSLFPLGGFGGAARDAAIALGLLSETEALSHLEMGPGYQDAVESIRRFAGPYRESAHASGIWDDLVLASRAEDPEDASKCVLRALVREATIARRGHPAGPTNSRN